MKNLLLNLWFIPRNIAIALILGYRHTISVAMGPVCRYYPSCSNYTQLSIAHHGFVRGVLAGGWRILRCNPWSSGGIDDPKPHKKPYFKITKIGFVVADSKQRKVLSNNA